MGSVDLTDVVAVTRGLVDIDSTTGREGDCILWMATLLSAAGYEVVEQVVEGSRRNIYAGFGKADVVLSTHLDCVPPFFPSHIDGDRLYGRGSCDAKGIAACQVAAAEALRREGITNVGLLFVVGEERGSDGAKTAQSLASGSKFLINGEPTDNRLGIGTRGALRYRLRAKGRAAHSSFPELGESAIEKLIDALVRLRAMDMPEHPVLGRTHYTVGIISGGVAPNVIPFEAEAEVMFRTGLRHRRASRIDVEPDAARLAGGDSGRSAGDHAVGAGLRHGDVPIHDRYPVPLELGHAAALRSGFNPRCAHRQRTREDPGSCASRG